MEDTGGPQASHIGSADEGTGVLYSPPLELQSFAVKDAPQGTFYFRNFVDSGTEEMLMQKVQNAPKTKWTQLRNRRLQSWGGTVQGNGMIQETLPTWILDQCRAVQNIAVQDVLFIAFPGLSSLPNHCLINEYLPGQGIMSHHDGPVYFPVVANLSLGSHTIMNLTRIKRDPADSLVEPPIRLLLEPRSLLLLSSQAYSSWMHGIDELTQDTIDSSVANLHLTSVPAADPAAPPVAFSLARATRVSLTIRYVPRVFKNPLKL